MSTIIQILYSIPFGLVRYWYLNGPSYLLGNEGMPLLDICSRRLGVSSIVLSASNGAEICENSINNHLTGYATAVLACVFVYFLSKLEPLVKELWSFLRSRLETQGDAAQRLREEERRRRINENGQRARKMNEEAYRLLDGVLTTMKNYNPHTHSAETTETMCNIVVCYRTSCERNEALAQKLGWRTEQANGGLLQIENSDISLRNFVNS